MPKEKVMTSLVIGTGEIGSALYEILEEKYGKKVLKYDIKDGEDIPVGLDLLHICIPWSTSFEKIVLDYIKIVVPKFTIIHSSVPVGTTERIGLKGKCDMFHSPVRGKHPNMKEGLRVYRKYISFDGGLFYEAQELGGYFYDAGIECKTLPDTKVTELAKLLALSRYGVYIAFAKEQEAICAKFDVPYHSAVTDFEKTRNEGLSILGKRELSQPLLFPFAGFVGGHCTVEDMELLLDQHDTPLLREAYNIGRNTQVWEPCNIYPSAKIGKGCSIGQFSEIGEGVIIGNNVRIGGQCFIPECVTIEDDVFVAPKVTFSNDVHPPSSRKEWGNILIKKGAMLGMGSIILPGVTVGESAVIGAGSVVTKNVGDGEVWYGPAAHRHGTREEVYKNES